MKRQVVLNPDTDPVVEAEVIYQDQPQTRRELLVAHPPHGEQRLATETEDGFITTDEVCKRLQISRGTLANWRRKNGGLPHVIIPGARSVRFFWPAVRDYCLRQQRNAL